MKSRIEAAIQKTINLYYSVTGYEPVGVHIEAVSDIYRRCLELAHSDEEKRRYEQSKDALSGLKGTIVWPARLEERPVILIDEKMFGMREDGIFYSTLTHELTHVHDFYAFAKHSGYHKPDAVWKDARFTVFYFWTEFHSRRVGYTIYRALMLRAHPKSRAEQARHILKEEEPFQLHILNEELKVYIEKNEPLLYMYSMVQFLARYSVWNDLFPRRVTQKNFPGELTGVFGHKIIDLYKYLHEHRDFESFIQSLRELQHLLNEFTEDFEEKKLLQLD